MRIGAPEYRATLTPSWRPPLVRPTAKDLLLSRFRVLVERLEEHDTLVAPAAIEGDSPEKDHSGESQSIRLAPERSRSPGERHRAAGSESRARLDVSARRR